MSFLSNVYGMALMFTAMMPPDHTEDKARLRKAWRDSMNLPRKTKKRVRKELLKEWEQYRYDCSFSF